MALDRAKRRGRPNGGPFVCPLSTHCGHKESGSSAHETLQSLSPYIDHHYAPVASEGDIMSYSKLAVIIAETTETRDDAAG